MNMKNRWVVAYLGPTETHLQGRDRIAEVLEAARCLASSDRTLVVVQESERPWWSVLTAAMPTRNVIAEPFDRGTATGIIAAILAIVDRDPSAEIAVVFGALSRRQAIAADEVLETTRANGIATFEESGQDRPLPLAVASCSAWLERIESVDRSRVAALRMALSGTDAPSDAIDQLYPYVTTLDFQSSVLGGEPGDRHVLPRAKNDTPQKATPASMAWA